MRDLGSAFAASRPCGKAAATAAGRTSLSACLQLHLAFTRALAIGEAMLHRSPLKLAVLAAATGAMALTSGCAGRGGKNKDTAYVARDVDTLYAAAKARLDRGDYKEAAALFDEVERQHPYSPWARRAQLMSAFSYYVARDYTKAIQSGQRFLSIHPGNKDAPYA